VTPAGVFVFSFFSLNLKSTTYLEKVIEF